MKPGNPIILALDVPGYDEAVEIVKKFSGHIEVFKVGSGLFTSSGPKIIKQIHLMGRKVFLDLKFHDIPNTVAASAAAAARLGVFMFNVHALGGSGMMRQAAEAIRKTSLDENIDRPKLIGVTILTSIDQNALRDELGIGLRMGAEVRHLAGLAYNAGLDGVVASPEDAENIRSHFGKDFLIVTPGIRPSWAAADDQKRMLAPREALRRGADYIVLGRAVLSQPDPLKALERIKEEISGLQR
ncbi:MAG: orotidine-5'-phosphate decarboxylase [Nitrospiraceae bacterium]|nr:MAG: orotidine-5'-phosphate decarboxylase [Nitrospiraceae bacterium]